MIKKELRKCIEFSIENYSEYLKSHKPKAVLSPNAEGFITICERCGEAILTPVGTINFRCRCITKNMRVEEMIEKRG